MKLDNGWKGIAALAVALLLVGCGGAAERKAKYFEKGKALHAQGQYDKAKLEVRNALQIDPKDIEARFLYGQILEAKQDLSSAASNYLLVIDANPLHAPARLRLGRLMLFSGAEERAREMADAVLKENPKNADALALRAGVHRRDGDTARAVADAQAALNEEPGNLDALSLLAGIYTTSRQPDKAAALLSEGLARNDKNVALRAMLADVYDRQGKTDRTIDELKNTVAIEPKFLAHRVRLASYYAKLKRVDDAEKVLRLAVNDLPEPVEPKLALVRFLLEQRGNEAAVTALKEFIVSDAKAHELRFALARLHEANNEREAAVGAYQAIVREDKTGPNGLIARTRLVPLRLAEGRTVEAAALIAEVLKENSRDNEALIWRAQMALDANDPASAVADVRTVLKDQPNDIRALRLLSAAHARNGEQTLALETLQKLVEIYPANVDSRLQYAQALRQNGRADKAQEQIKAALKVNPQHVGAWEASFQLALVKRDWTGAQEAVRQMKAMVPASGLGEYSSGQLNEAQNRLEAALSDYNAALVKNPNAFEPLSGVVRVYVTQKKPALATARLEKIIQTEPKHVLAHNLLGEVQLLQGRYVEAEAALQEANRLAPKVVTTIRNLANVKLALKNVDGAEAVYREGLAATNHDVNLHLEFAAFYQRLDRIDPAIREYERLLEKHSGQPVASNNLAMLLVTHRHDKASVERASRLSESLSRSDNAAYLDTVGWVHYKRGQYDNAIHALEKAIAKAPKEPLLRYHLGMAYFGKGEPKMAQDHLKRAVESQVNFHGRDEAQSTLERIQSTS